MFCLTNLLVKEAACPTIGKAVFVVKGALEKLKEAKVEGSNRCQGGGGVQDEVGGAVPQLYSASHIIDHHVDDHEEQHTHNKHKGVRACSNERKLCLVLALQVGTSLWPCARHKATWIGPQRTPHTENASSKPQVRQAEHGQHKQSRALLLWLRKLFSAWSDLFVRQWSGVLPVSTVISGMTIAAT